ncbi:hypothetical protein GVAV_003311 [Gurleya vavrai]
MHIVFIALSILLLLNLVQGSYSSSKSSSSKYSEGRMRSEYASNFGINLSSSSNSSGVSSSGKAPTETVLPAVQPESGASADETFSTADEPPAAVDKKKEEKSAEDENIKPKNESNSEIKIGNAPSKNVIEKNSTIFYTEATRLIGKDVFFIDLETMTLITNYTGKEKNIVVAVLAPKQTQKVFVQMYVQPVLLSVYATTLNNELAEKKKK